MSPARSVAMSAFLFGAILGAVAGSWGQRAMFHRMRKGPDLARMMNKLNRELVLDEKQQAEIHTVLDARKTELDALKKDAQARFEAIRTATDADLRKSLRSDQQAKFDVMTARWRARMRERLAEGGPLL
jgi:hypothetical protein